VLQFLKSKIHRARVTAASLDYEGSFGIDVSFMRKVGIHSFESIEVYNISSGTRLRTYAIPLPEGSRRFESNGAAAHLVKEGDEVILVSYQWFTEQELQAFVGPKIALMNPENNQLKHFYQPDWRKTDGSKSLEEFDILPPGTRNSLALHPDWV